MLRSRFFALGFALLCAHCGSDDKNDNNTGQSSGGSDSNGGAQAETGGAQDETGGTESTGGIPTTGAGGTSSGGATPTGGTSAATGGSSAGTGGSVPVDPNSAQLPDIRCGGTLDKDFRAPYTMITDRRVFIDYPCNRPKGTKVTFVLNLHGTMPLEEGKSYIRVYNGLGPNVVDHDFIVATPVAIGSQWGNGDGGKDAPHLADVIKWVYDNGTQFDIKQMWVTGHSWGAVYALNFVCKPEYQDKIRGLMFMSGGANMPTCADRLSVIATVGETDIVPGQPDQSATAAKHGCATKSERQLGQDKITEWANCSKGWQHQNWLMLGKGHGFDPKDWPDKAMTDLLADEVAATLPD